MTAHTKLIVLFALLGLPIGVRCQDQVANQFRITQGSNAGAFVLLPATGTAQQTILMPPDPPFANGFGLVVREVTGSTVQTAWAPPWDPGSASRWIRKTADEANGSTVTWEDADDMRFYVTPNKSYYIEGFFRVNNSGDAGADVQINFVVPTGAVINYYYVSSTQIGGSFQSDDADVSAGYTETAPATFRVNSATVRYYNVQGLIVTGSSAGYVQVQFRRSGGAGTVNMLQNSILKVFTD